MRQAIDDFLQLPVWNMLNRGRLIALAEAATERRLPASTFVTRQFYPAEYFMFLYSGAVQHQIEPDRGGHLVQLSPLSWRWAPIGWSGFLASGRHTTTVMVEADAVCLCWSHATLANCFYADPEIAVRFLRLVVNGMRRQVIDARDIYLSDHLEWRRPYAPYTDTQEPPARPLAPTCLNVLRRSSFFGVFDDATLTQLAEGAVLNYFAPGQAIVDQDAPVDGVWVLATGEAQACFCRVDRAPSQDEFVAYRSLLDPGEVIAGLPGDIGPERSEARVDAGQRCHVYQLARERLAALAQSNPEFGRTLMQRSLAHVANHFSAISIHHAAGVEDPELDAVRRLLDHNGPRLRVTSELHKLPHLLRDRLTIGNAFACLNTVRQTGSYVEQSMAGLCQDLLVGMRAELYFYRDVLDTYDAVVHAPPLTSPAALRHLTDEGLQRAFGHLDCRIAGWENLPDTPGHIFMLNHLACPEYYAFPNNYHFTFDTAFVSAMILYPRYGESALRVVRRSPGIEFGHDLFYSRLGHPSVYTEESGLEEWDEEVANQMRQQATGRFIAEAQSHLQQRRNLIICPEGSSQRAAASPARFRSGAFRVAAGVDPEPFIVPIALANFDQRYKDYPLAAIIKAPFRLSEVLPTVDFASLRLFLDQFRETYRAYIAEARALAARSRPDAQTVEGGVA